jgi:hypothetical protein
MRTTLKELAASGDLASRGAAALIKAGYADSTPLKELTPAVSHARSPRRSRANSRRCTSSSGEVHESAFLETATGDSVEVLVDGLCPRRAWWWRLFRPRSS